MSIASTPPICNAHYMQMITAKAKAEELGVTRATITRMVQDGRLTPVYQVEGLNGPMFFAPEPTTEGK